MIVNTCLKYNNKISPIECMCCETTTKPNHTRQQSNKLINIIIIIIKHAKEHLVSRFS